MEAISAEVFMKEVNLEEVIPKKVVLEEVVSERVMNGNMDVALLARPRGRLLQQPVAATASAYLILSCRHTQKDSTPDRSRWLC